MYRIEPSDAGVRPEARVRLSELHLGAPDAGEPEGRERSHPPVRPAPQLHVPSSRGKASPAQLERLCRAVVAAAFLLLAVPASHAVEGAQSPDTDLSRAQALLERGQPYTALAILVPLARSDPKREDVLFLLGLAAIEAARRQPETAEAERERLLELAIAALHTILVDQPDLVRVRLELARAFFLNGEDSLARGHFERVLAGEVPEAVAANVQQFLDQIRARRRWSMYLGATLAPDTNIGAGSDEEIILIGLPFQDKATSGVGVAVRTGGEYQHPLGDRLRLRAGADLARTEHAGRAFDDTNLSGHVGPRWLVDRDTELSLLANVHRRWKAGNIDHDDVGARIEVRQRLTPQVTGRAGVLVPARLPGPGPSERPRRRYPVERYVDDQPDPAGQCRVRTRTATSADGRAAQPQPPGADGSLRGPATGLHRGGQRAASLDGLRRRPASLHPGR